MHRRASGGLRRSGVALIAAAMVVALLAVSEAAVGAASSEPLTFVSMSSEDGDWIGGGQTRLYTPALGSVTVTGTDELITVSVVGGTLGDDYWIQMAPPSGEHLKIKAYGGARGFPPLTFGHPGLSVWGDGRGCNQATGRFDIRDIAFDQRGMVIRLRALFEHHCEGDVPALFGEVAFGVPTPESFVAAASSVWFSPSAPGVAAPVVPVHVFGTDPGTSIDEVSITGLHADDFDVRVDTCAGTTLAVDEICQIFVRLIPANPGPRVASLVIRGEGTARRVQLDGRGVGGSFNAAFESDPDDWIGDGGSYAFDPLNSVMSVGGSYELVAGRIDTFTGDYFLFWFEAPAGDALAPGATFEATRYPLNGTGAGMAVWSTGRACNELVGTFTINELSVKPNGTVRSLSVDFEQHCEGLDPAFSGEIRFDRANADAERPAAPTELKVARRDGGRAAVVTWVDPPTDFAFAIVRFAVGGPPPSGPLVQRFGYAGAKGSVRLVGLNPNRSLGVAVWPVDAAGNVGRPVTAVSR